MATSPFLILWHPCHSYFVVLKPAHNAQGDTVPGCAEWVNSFPNLVSMLKARSLSHVEEVASRA